MGRRRRTQPRDIPREAQAAAYLYSHGNDQARIADLLAVSQGEVSRLLGWARREGWLRLTCALPDDAVAEVEQLVFRARGDLQQRLRDVARRAGVAPLRSLRILHSGGEDTESAAWDARLLRFGRLAAARIEELLPRLHLVGITWGKTMARLVDGLHQIHPSRPRLPHPVQVIPLTGEPLTFPEPETSSSHLAHRLNELCQADAVRPFHSLAAVPAFIPARFTRQSRKTIREFIAEIAGYRVIFEPTDAQGRPQQPLADCLDALITSVGTVSAEISGRLLDDRMLAENTTKESLQGRVVGDIGGIFLPRSPRDGVVRGINERWTGVQLAHLTRCARAAHHDPRRVGVIVLALGRTKAEIVLECLRLGLIQELIIDHDLAQALLDQTGEDVG